MEVKIKIPAIAHRPETNVDYNEWLRILQGIKSYDVTQDTKRVKRWTSDLKRHVLPSDLSLPITGAKIHPLTDKSTKVAIVDPKTDKTKLINLNNEVGSIIEKFEKDTVEIVAASKELKELAQRDTNDKTYAQVLRKAVLKVAALNTRHNAMMNIPVITHAALNRVCKALK